MKVLGIETSCDETAAAVVEDGQVLHSNVIASSVDLHAAYGGVVPEIAARSHLESIIPVIDEAVKDTGWDSIDAIGVTYGPGLSGSLLIGLTTARTLSVTKNKPLYAVDHVQAHVYATFLTKTSLPGYKLPDQQPKFPLLALIVSGGHTQLVLFKDHFSYQVLGQTTDDAIGEAFDKVAKIVGLPYPGGPSVAKAAELGDPEAIKLPIAKLDNIYNFSYSGLKTAVLRAAQAMVGKDFTLPSYELPDMLEQAQKNDIAASFQHTALESLVKPVQTAVSQFRPASIIVAGGVAASQPLRKLLSERINQPITYTDMRLCTDNAAMIAANTYYQIKYNQSAADVNNLGVDPSLQM